MEVSPKVKIIVNQRNFSRIIKNTSLDTMDVLRMLICVRASCLMYIDSFLIAISDASVCVEKEFVQEIARIHG